MKILVTSVSAGSGHVRAAEALEVAFQKTFPSAQVSNIDAMNFVTKGFRRAYIGGYNFAVNRVPDFWGYVYNFMDKETVTLRLGPFINSRQRRRAGAFLDFVYRVQPDLILSTHFLPPQLLEQEVEMGRLKAPVHTVITDYDVHRSWVSPAVSHYYVAHEGMTQKLVQLGVREDHISATGIPIHPIFSRPVSKRHVMEDLGLEPRIPTVLVLSGGLGLSVFKHAVQELVRFEKRIQIITVSGRNTRLREALSRLEVPSHVTLVNFGFVSNMHELLSVSDVVVTKPGGLTVSECLSKGSTMVLFSPIPGQEERNADYVSSRMAGIKANSRADLVQSIQNLLENPLQRAFIKDNAQSLSNPDAAYTIAELAASSLVNS